MNTDREQEVERAVPPDQIAALRRAAIDYVSRATGCGTAFDVGLDLGSQDGEASLAFVDHYIEQVRRGPPPQPEVQQLIASALGAYLGELCIARFGGRWRMLPETESANGWQMARWRVELEAAPLRIDPIAMAMEALGVPAVTDDEEHLSTPSLALTLTAGSTHLQAPLQAALERLEPVSVDYYYSLTGRFETLAYTVEVLLGLQQREVTEEGVPRKTAEPERPANR